MRWGSNGNGGFVVGASAYTLAPRDKNPSYYYYQDPSVPCTADVFGVSQSGQARGILHDKKSLDKRQGRKPVRSSARPLRQSCELKVSLGAIEEAATDCPEVASERTGHSPLIMCAGKSVYGSSDDTRGCNSRSNNRTDQHSDASSGKTLEHSVSPGRNDNNARNENRMERVQSATAAKLKRVSEHSSPPLHRTDEELEQIIRDLRDQVFQHQQKQDRMYREKSRPTTSSHEGAACSLHQRRYLKNPIEKMEGVATSLPVASSLRSSVAASNRLLLQRPLSSSHLNRLVTESTIQMVVPAIIYEASPTTGRISSKPSCGQVPSLDFEPLTTVTPRSRPNSSSDYHQGERPPTRLGEVAILNPRHPRSMKLSGKPRVRHDKDLERRQDKERYQDRYERSSDHWHSHSFLYLVDVDDTENDPESISLSPVGPWVVDDFITPEIDTATPRSPSVSTCYSFGSDDLDFGGGDQWSHSHLAALSPRSRLLYFSACSDDGEVSRGTLSQLHHLQTLRRSATCASGLIESMKLASLEARPAKPKRCSSAKSITRGRARLTSSASGSKQKTTNRVHQTRKRPQSGRAASSRSIHIDGTSNNS